MELGNTEVYYWVFSSHLQWNYFDHPPMVAWIIRLTTINNLLHSELAVRAGAILCSGVSTYIIFKAGEAIQGQQTGWYAALLYTAGFYSSIAAGSFILPDSPQMVFWLVSILILIKILHIHDGNKRAYILWCLFGISAGLCIMSKIHGIFLWLGVMLFALLFRRTWLSKPWIYLSALITCVIISPILIWNIQHGYATLFFHGGRISVIGFSIDLSRFLKQLIAIVLICNPVNFFLVFTGLRKFASGKLDDFKSDILLLLFCSLPLIILLLFVSLFREIYPHWPGPALCSLLILPALYYSKKYQENKITLPRRFGWALLVLLVLTGAQIGVTLYAPGTFSHEKDLYAGKDDPTLDMYGWKNAGLLYDSLYRKDVSDNIMSPASPFIVTKWYPAGHLDYYFGFRTNQQTIGLGDVEQLHQYFWFNNEKKKLISGENAYYIIPSNLLDFKAFDQVVKSFKSYNMPLTIKIYRSGILCKQIYIFRLMGYQPSTPNPDNQ
jgi:4-amino-4-deoxy-L-arabinose transferase-like glycosyltransferase